MSMMENQISTNSSADDIGTPGMASGGGAGRTAFAIVRTVLAAFIIAGVIVSAGYAGLCAYAAN